MTSHNFPTQNGFGGKSALKNTPPSTPFGGGRVKTAQYKTPGNGAFPGVLAHTPSWGGRMQLAESQHAGMRKEAWLGAARAALGVGAKVAPGLTRGGMFTRFGMKHAPGLTRSVNPVAKQIGGRAGGAFSGMFHGQGADTALQMGTGEEGGSGWGGLIGAGLGAISPSLARRYAATSTGGVTRNLALLGYAGTVSPALNPEGINIANPIGEQRRAKNEFAQRFGLPDMQAADSLLQEYQANPNSRNPLINNIANQMQFAADNAFQPDTYARIEELRKRYAGG